MNKRLGWLLIAAVIAALGIGFALMIDKVSVSGSSVALANSGWKANFSEPIRPEAIERGNLYLTDDEGERLEPTMTLHENQKTLEVTDLPPGNYTLHITSDALKSSFFQTLAMKEVTFTVQSELESLTSEEELREYFARLLTLQESRERYGVFSGEGEATAESSEADSSGGEGGGNYSTTNNQVEGVDEADTVKTDGSFIYSITDSKVAISDVRNPAALEQAAIIDFDRTMYPGQLFLSGDTLIVLGNRYFEAGGQKRTMETSMPAGGMTSVFLYDVSDPSAPQLIREFGTEGNLNGARLTGNVLYYVTNVYPPLYELNSAEEAELRPHLYDSKNGDQFDVLPYDRITILPGTLEGSYSVISALDLSDPVENEISTKGYLGGSEQLYMTEETLYLTASAYVPLDEETQQEASMDVWIPESANTEIFKFRLSGSDVEFVASSEVTGRLLNQFSMDEHNGYFRMVTTEGFAWEEASPSKNHLFILDSELNLVGSVEDLAPGERIYSARFMGNTAYMVTFKETDPLFVIDVSTPSAPEVLGELKIPGFSNYLHPLGEDHLIGFGYDTRLEQVKGGEPVVVTGGMKISLFDVSDFANPVEKDTEIIGGPGTYSPLQYDHKALFIHPDKNLYGFPVTMYEEVQENRLEFGSQGALLYNITPEGIEEAARLLEGSEAPYEDWNVAVQRLVYIEDTLYAVANSELKSYNLATFEQKDHLAF